MLLFVIMLFLSRIYSYSQKENLSKKDKTFEKDMSISLESFYREDNEDSFSSIELSVENDFGSKFDFAEFKKEKCIGRGSFGTVFLCSISDSERKFAVKILEKEVLYIWIQLKNPNFN